MIPVNATHHELGPNGYAYYDASSKPHKKWTGLGWYELGQYADCTTWAVPIDEEAKVKPSNAAHTYRTYCSNREWSNE